MSSHVLNLETANSAGGPVAYPERLEDDRVENSNRDKLDAWAGVVSGSFCTRFFVSGTVTANQGMDIGCEYAQVDRVITEVVAYAPVSGSGGVTRINVLRQQDGPGQAFVSIYSNDAFKPALSASLGNYGIARGGEISGSVWAAGTLLKATFDTAATLQRDVTVCVMWKPRFSYGA